MKVKLIKSITVSGGKAKKGDVLDASPKIVEKLILRGYATTKLDETKKEELKSPIVKNYRPVQPLEDDKDANKSS